MFRIVCAGWSCAKWMPQTFASIEAQDRTDWQVCVAYDDEDGGGAVIVDFLSRHQGGEALAIVNPPGYFKMAVRNRFLAIALMEPKDDDIIIFLDLDGDQLAHPDVLQHLAEAYADGALLTYGNYRAVPDDPPSPPAEPFPADVIARNAYREHIRQGRGTCFNHLRTMSGRVFKAIPLEQFKWPDGEWYTNGVDYIFTVAGLELAGPRHKCFEEVLMLYNHANDKADYLMNPTLTGNCVADFLTKTPLSPLP